MVSTFNGDGLPTAEKVYQASVGGTVLTETDTAYDSNGPSTVTTIVGSKSKQVAFSYDSYGNLSSQDEYDWNSTSSVLRDTTYTYNTASGYLNANIIALVSSKTVTEGSTVSSYTEYSYDGKSLSGTTDTTAIAMTNVSGAAGHDDINYSASSTTPRGNLTRMVQYTSGTTSGPLNTLYGYDSLGNLVQVNDPKGNITTLSYADSWDSGTSGCSIGSGSAGAQAYPTTIVQGYGSGYALTSTATYSKCIGQAITATDANSKTMTFGYADALLRLKQVTNPDNASGTPSVQYGYNHYVSSTSTKATNTVQTLQTGSVAPMTTTTLDGLGRTLKVVAATGAQVDYVYGFDSTNHLAYQKVSNPYITGAPAFTESDIDPLGRPAKTVLADGSSTATASYTDNCVTATDPAGLNRKTCNDPLGRIGAVYEDPNGVSGSTALNYLTTYLYDGLDNVTGICQGSAFSGTTCPTGSQGRSFTYDGLGRMTSETTPEAGTTNYYYVTSSSALCSGDTSQLCRTSDNMATPVVKTYSYDALNRLTGKSYSDSTSAVSYIYDQTSYNGLTIANGKGRRTGMSDGSGATAWSFDANGRVVAIRKTITTAVSSVTKEADSSYYYDGTPHQLTDYGGTTYTYGYNSTAQLQSIADPTNTYASSATYQPSGALDTLVHQLTSGSTSYTRKFTPNALLQPSTIQAYPTASPTSQFLNLSYTYATAANNGSIQSITDAASGHTGRNQTFTYDTLNRIQSAKVGSSTWGTQYGYDQFSNLTSGSTLSGYSSGDNWSATQTNNKLSSNGYDADGRATTVNGSISYGYDAEGRILQSGITHYRYDGDGYRVSKFIYPHVYDVTLYWPGPSGAIIDESDAYGSSFGRQVWFGGLQVWSEDTNGNGRFLFQDHLGSTRVTASASGTMLDDIDYAPFGAQIANHGSGSTNHYNFTGYESDIDGSNYATFRNMDSVHGRFGRPDPYLGSYDLNNPQSLNRYSYVLNDPMNWTDPSGLNYISCVRDVYYITDDGKRRFDHYGDWECTNVGGSGGSGSGSGGGGGGGTLGKAPSHTKLVAQCTNQNAPSIGKIGNDHPGWVGQNLLGNDISTLVGVFTGPDASGARLSALASNIFDSVGGPTSLVSIVTGVIANYQFVSPSKVGIRYNGAGKPYAVDFMETVSKTSIGATAFRGIAVLSAAKLGFDAISYAYTLYYCSKAM